MALTKVHNRMIDGAVINVLDYGAKGDGATDDFAAIQAAVDAAIAGGEPFSPVYFPTGNYFVSQEIDRSGTGVYVDLYGDGQRNTIITATAVMDSVIKLSTTGNIARSTTIRDMTIRCNSKANYGVDAKNMRYWTMQNIEVTNALVAGVILGNWVTRFLNNKLESCAIGVLVDGIAASSSAANNLSIYFNDFDSCPIGLKVQNKSNDITIQSNAFDACADCGIFINHGGRDINITSNYFESCGNGTGISIPIDTTPTNNITRAAAIIASYDPSATVGTALNGTIQDNIFANCNSSRYIVLSNVLDVLIQENKIHDSYTVVDFVELVAIACGSTTCARCEITGVYPSTIVTNSLVKLNGNDPEDSHSNLVIDNKDKDGGQTRAMFSWNDPKSAVNWAGATTINETQYQGCLAEFEYDAIADGSNVVRSLSVTFSADNPLLGRYLRTQFMTKGSSTTTGVWVQIFIDGVEQIDFQRSSSSSTYVESARASVIYVPTTATNMEIRTRALSSSANAKMTGFCVCDAAIGIAETPIKRAS